MAVPRDPDPDKERDLRRLSEVRLIRLVAQGRDSDDPSHQQAALEAWRQLLVGEYDRVRAMVVTFRWRGHEHVRVAPEDYEDVAQKALERCLRALRQSFRGESVGEFRNAVSSCVQFACMDHLRQEMARDKKRAGSLDETVADEQGQERGRFDSDIARIEGRIEAGRFDARIELRDVASAIEGLPDERMRDVLRLKAAGFASAEIAERLGLSKVNVDQLASRGRRRLDEAGGAHAS
ncbi:MAG: sigma-70 family RNA polymerase sigma factor [Solirubrobacteraceae bacterium]